MVFFSVHTPCIFVSSSTVSNCLDQKPMAWGAGWVEQRPRLTLAWAGSAEPTVPCHCGPSGWPIPSAGIETAGRGYTGDFLSK